MVLRMKNRIAAVFWFRGTGSTIFSLFPLSLIHFLILTPTQGDKLLLAAGSGKLQKVRNCLQEGADANYKNTVRHHFPPPAAELTCRRDRASRSFLCHRSPLGGFAPCVFYDVLEMRRLLLNISHDSRFQ